MALNSSNMVATSTAALKKVPKYKDQWLLSYKNYVLTEAGSRGISKHLEGTAVKPSIGTNRNRLRNRAKNFTQVKYEEEKLEKYEKLQETAWKFIYGIETHLATLLDSFMETHNAADAWTAIVDYYEKTQSGNRQSELEQKLDNLEIFDHNDLKIDFLKALNDLEQITNALAAYSCS